MRNVLHTSMEPSDSVIRTQSLLGREGGRSFTFRSSRSKNIPGFILLLILYLSFDTKLVRVSTKQCVYGQTRLFLQTKVCFEVQNTPTYAQSL